MLVYFICLYVELFGLFNELVFFFSSWNIVLFLVSLRLIKKINKLKSVVAGK